MIAQCASDLKDRRVSETAYMCVCVWGGGGGGRGGVDGWPPSVLATSLCISGTER